MTAPWLWIIGGPNGVGKTTCARAQLRQVAGTIHFVNTDELARGLSPMGVRIPSEWASPNL